MKVHKHEDMIKGWFVGDFEPTAFSTKESEVALQKYKEGDIEQRHVHKVATELTLIVSGKVLMNGVEYGEGDVIVIEPGEATDFKALTDVTNVVVKVPSVKGDKYPA
jgi:quercetin dioxygenase-like cupin family protein